jgi:hypothetical protein
MMKIEAIIPRRFWKNSATGQVASVYGACPNANDLNWQIKTEGYVFRLTDGTVHNFGGVFPTIESAQGVVESEKARLPRAYENHIVQVIA